MVCFQGKPFNITVIQVDAPTTDAEEAELFYEDLQVLLELTSPVLRDIKVDRWKILKMKLYTDCGFDNSDLDVSMDEFRYFVKTHENLIDNTVVEDTLKNSYIIIDSEGYLIDNSDDKNTKTINVCHEDFLTGFSKIGFNKELYFSRYRDDRG